MQEETQKVIKSAEENLTDMMLAAEKVIESVTVSPSVSVLPPPITLQQAPQPPTQGQVQQNDTSPPIGQQQSTQPSSLGQVSPSVGTRISPNPYHHVEQSHSITRGTINQNLKALKVPQFDGNKATFEEFWCLFESLVDKSTEPVNIKMARFRECLSGRALEAIRGLGVSEAEYNEAKEIIQSKFGGERRQLRAYMEELEKIYGLS